jgi:hypothetical protein
MSNETIILLSNISTSAADDSFSFSDKRPGAGYHNQPDCLHTAVYTFHTFSGTFKLQATLALDPSDADWFDIIDTEYGGDSATLDGLNSYTVNFSGNFVWIRAAYNIQNGSIQSIQYNF